MNLVSQNQFSFMVGRTTTEAIYILRGLMESYQSDMHMPYGLYKFGKSVLMCIKRNT